MTLENEVLQSIAKMKVAKVGKRLDKAHGMEFVVEDSVYKQIADQCNQVDIGARQIDHALDRIVLPALSRQLLEQMAEAEMPAKVTMGTNDAGEFTYSFSS